MNTFTRELYRELSALRKKAESENEKAGKDGVRKPIPSNIMSNATPEAIEMAMRASESGRFIVSSSEQGAIDRLLNIGVRDRSVDNDIVLKGLSVKCTHQAGLPGPGIPVKFLEL